ncbi:MAG: PAS domain S-box protein [Luteitalea sp.]|nr:PAS domain S-box protein [Luteitalea sp.]
MAGSTERLPVAARVYVAAVTVVGVWAFVSAWPLDLRKPLLFAGLFALAAVASAFKMQVPLPRGWATMSPGYAVIFAGLLLLGVDAALLMAVVSAWIQSTFHARSPQPHYRKLFNAAVLVLSAYSADAAMTALGGRSGDPSTVLLMGPLLGATTAYFVVNSIAIASVVALTTGQPVLRCWQDNFLWSGPGYYLGAALAAACVIVIERGAWWLTLFVAVPVHLIYYTYRVYFTRLQKEQARVKAIADLHAKAVEALASEKERLAVTVSSIGDGVITTDLEGRITLLNNVAEQLTGWPQDEAVGHDLSEVLLLVERTTATPREHPLARVLATGRIPETEAHCDLVGRSGNRVPVHLTGAPICDRDGRQMGVVLGARDVTEGIRLERERVRASKLESLGVMAGGIAHDFNNVLTAVVGNLALAQQRNEQLSDDTTMWLEEAEKACLRARGLTHQLLTFSKGGDPVKRSTYVGGLVDAAVRFAVRGSNVRCLVDAPPDLWPVEVDEGQFEQVVNNIVINAQQAMPRGGVIEVRCANVWASPPNAELPVQDKPFVRIGIRDHGTGIAPEDLTRIFDPYFTTKLSGTGLGLAVAHSVIKGHGGFINVESVDGSGANFNIFLPRALRTTVQPAVSPTASVPRGAGRILVMDDERMISDVTGAMLRALGYESEAVSDGRQALERYRAAQQASQPFSAVIMDLTIPGGMGGVEAVGHLRELDPQARVLVVSGYADSGVLADYAQHGFDALLPKPFSLRDLALALSSLLKPEGESTIH